ncbi:MAG: MBL fold metallo-hydrolase [Bryobacteraceae bacterium]
MGLLLKGLLPFFLLVSAAMAKPMQVYFIDVEGGQATLIVSPSGQSMLVDTGWAGFEGRDADRIAAAAKDAGVKQIDYLVITHYHGDHVGGVTQLAAKLPIRTFVDHGPNTETGANAEKLSSAWQQAYEKAKHLVVKPGDRIPVKGLDIKVLAARGELVKGGSPNPHCGGFEMRKPDPTENARSLGTLIAHGKFRLVDLGDLTWNKEHELVCPNNPIGKVDVYLSTHHGTNTSGPASIVHALAPRVAVFNNGAKKGGSPEAWKVVRSSPGIEDIWQLHFALAGGQEHNTAEQLTANPQEQCEGKWIKLSAEPDGTFTLINGRNGHQKTYKPKG